MKIHWREWFARANLCAWQATDVPQTRVDEFIGRDLSNCTETMYQAFKARLTEESGIDLSRAMTNESTDGSPND